MLNSHLRQWRESSVRKLELLEDRKLVLFYSQEETRLVRSNSCKRTPLDILHSFMNNETTFGHNYPDSDKAVTFL